MGHQLFIAPNRVILSGENIPMVTIFEGEEIHVWSFSTHFPVIMKFAPKWHPNEDPEKWRTEQESWRRSSRAGQSSSSSSQGRPRGKIPPQGRPNPKAAPRPSQAPSQEARQDDSDEDLPPPPPPPGPRPRPTTAAGINRMYVRGPIDWEVETRLGGLFELKTGRDRFDDLVTKAHFWHSLTEYQKLRLMDSGVEDEIE